MSGGDGRAWKKCAGAVADDADEDRVVHLLRLQRNGHKQEQNYREQLPKHVGSFVVFARSPCFGAWTHKEKGPEA